MSHSGPMLTSVQAHLDATQGVLTRREAHRLGVQDGTLRRLVHERRLARVAQGAYVERARLDAAPSPEARHALVARAVSTVLPTDTAMSHYSAACVLGLPVLGSPPPRVRAVRLHGGEHRKASGYTIHAGYPGARTVTRNGLRVIEPAFVVFGLAVVMGLQAAVVAADAALNAGLMAAAELDRVIATCPRWPGLATLAAAAALVDPACESAGETLTRLVLLDLGFSVQSQAVIRDSRGSPVARVDFLIDGTAVIVEFDGMQKYQHADGRPNAAALRAEKLREDQLRSLGYEVVRLVWADLKDPARVRQLLNAALARAARG